MTAPVVLLVACALGAVVSGLSTRDHVRYRVSGGLEAGACAALSDTGCRSAHASRAAEILGVPISHFGTGFYLAGAGLAVLALERRRRVTSASGIAPLVTLMGLGAVGYSGFLASILIRAGESCPLCIALYCVNAAMLAVGATWWLRGQRTVSLRAVLVPGAVAVGVGGVSFGSTTPFLMQALAETTAGATAGPANSGGKMASQLLLPSRIPSKGAPTADDSLVEFSDLDCSHCALMHRTVASVFEERGPSRLRVRFVNYPLDQECNPRVGRSVHPTACLAARGAICAQEQDRFWPYADAYFALLEPGSRAAVVDTARSAGLDMDQFTACLDAEQTARILVEDVALAHAAGVRATPTVLVNGWMFEGAIPRARLLKILDDTTPCGCDMRSSDGTCPTVLTGIPTGPKTEVHE